MKTLTYALAIVGWTCVVTWYAPIPLNGPHPQLTSNGLLAWAKVHSKDSMR